MDELFSIAISHKNQEYTFEVRLVSIGYTHKFFILINGTEVVYEPDEERNYRAIVTEANTKSISDRDIELIAAVGEKIGLIQQS